MKDITLTREQMKHLQDIGIDVYDNPSFGWIQEEDDDWYNMFADECGEFTDGCIPAFTVQDADDYIWKHYNFKKLLNIAYCTYEDNPVIMIDYIKNKNTLHEYFDGDTLTECAYNMLLWFADKKYLK